MGLKKYAGRKPILAGILRLVFLIFEKFEKNRDFFQKRG